MGGLFSRLTTAGKKLFLNLVVRAVKFSSDKRGEQKGCDYVIVLDYVGCFPAEG